VKSLQQTLHHKRRTWNEARSLSDMRRLHLPVLPWPYVCPPNGWQVPLLLWHAAHGSSSCLAAAAPAARCEPTTAQPPAAPGASPSTTARTALARRRLWRRAKHQQRCSQHACRALIHDRSQYVPPPCARAFTRPAGSLTPSPGPPALQRLAPQPLSQTSAQRHRTYFLLNNKAVNRVRRAAAPQLEMPRELTRRRVGWGYARQPDCPGRQQKKNLPLRAHQATKDILRVQVGTLSFSHASRLGVNK
jgi:hypothetical protein